MRIKINHALLQDLTCSLDNSKTQDRTIGDPEGDYILEEYENCQRQKMSEMTMEKPAALLIEQREEQRTAAEQQKTAMGELRTALAEEQRTAANELRTALAEEQRTAVERLEKTLDEQREEQKTSRESSRNAR